MDHCIQWSMDGYGDQDYKSGIRLPRLHQAKVVNCLTAKSAQNMKATYSRSMSCDDEDLSRHLCTQRRDYACVGVDTRAGQCGTSRASFYLFLQINDPQRAERITERGTKCYVFRFPTMLLLQHLHIVQIF